MEPNETTPLVVQLDDADSPCDVIDALALVPFVAGTQRCARSVDLQRVRADAPLLPDGVIPTHRAVESTRQSHLARSDGWTLRVVRYDDATANISVTAVSDDLARQVLAAVTAGAVEPPPVDRSTTHVGFWSQTPRGPNRAVRALDVEPWSATRRNYARSVAAALDRLMRLTPATLSGRLLLLHGPPGTGKTTALLSLAKQWSKWCRVDYVLDPEALLSVPAYLLRVVLDHDTDEAGSDAGAARWRMLVLEDCDDLIRATAREGNVQAVSRLLNLTDGLVGQGLRVLVCVTTNEELSRLHPAVARPGRCLAQIHVGRFSRAEAIEWLGSSEGVGPNGATLAELCALRNGSPHVVLHESPQHVGLYL